MRSDLNPVAGASRSASFPVEVLTAAELDAVFGGNLMMDSLDAEGCSCTVSQCHMDGNNEPGTS